MRRGVLFVFFYVIYLVLKIMFIIYWVFNIYLVNYFMNYERKDYMKVFKIFYLCKNNKLNVIV